MGSELKVVVPGVARGGKLCTAGGRGTCSRKGCRYLAQRILIKKRRDQRKSCLSKLSFVFLM